MVGKLPDSIKSKVITELGDILGSKGDQIEFKTDLNPQLAAGIEKEAPQTQIVPNIGRGVVV